VRSGVWGAVGEERCGAWLGSAECRRMESLRRLRGREAATERRPGRLAPLSGFRVR
jgi:hypothetical protein